MLGEIIAMIEERALAGQLDEPTAWRDRVKPLTAGHFARWLPQSHRNAMALVDNVRAGHGLEISEGQEDVQPKRSRVPSALADGRAAPVAGFGELTAV